VWKTSQLGVLSETTCAYTNLVRASQRSAISRLRDMLQVGRGRGGGWGGGRREGGKAA
jgi:hypothetical protein